jgi:hypothetical protein
MIYIIGSELATCNLEPLILKELDGKGLDILIYYWPKDYLDS